MSPDLDTDRRGFILNATQSELETIALEPHKMAKLLKWISALAIIRFDLDTGPVLDGCFPRGCLANDDPESMWELCLTHSAPCGLTGN